MTNLEILSEDKILTLKNNKKQVLDCMLSSSNNSWLKDFFREENPFSKSKLMVKDFDLKLADEDNLQYFDLDNAINKYTEAMKLAKFCSEKLNDATTKVNKILTEDNKLEEFNAE